MTLDIPDEVRAGSSLDGEAWEREAKKELALAFYARGLMSAGMATRLAGVARMQFESWLGERKILRPLDAQDLSREVE